MGTLILNVHFSLMVHLALFKTCMQLLYRPFSVQAELIRKYLDSFDTEIMEKPRSFQLWDKMLSFDKECSAACGDVKDVFWKRVQSNCRVRNSAEFDFEEIPRPS